MLSQHCVSTYIGHRNEIWSMDMKPVTKEEAEQQDFVPSLLTGSSDQQIRVFELKKSQSSQEQKELVNMNEETFLLELKGSLSNTTTASRTNTIRFSKNGYYFGWQVYHSY